MKQSDYYASISDGLLQMLDIQRLVKFDEAIAELFQSVFYSLLRDLQTHVDEPGIVIHFLRNWKDTASVSCLSTTLPALITGSIIEGACLSRIFHSSSQEKSMELEADVMYLVGSIDEKTAKKFFENAGITGFLKVKFSEDIVWYTNEKLVSLNEIIEKNGQENVQYINGMKLKLMHSNLKSSQRQLQFSGGVLYLVSIQQKLSGPSSEIVFTTQPIYEKYHVDEVLRFITDIKFILNEWCDKFLKEFEHLHELFLILKSVTDAMVKQEKNRLDNKKVTMTLEEASDIMTRINEKIALLDDGSSKLEDEDIEMVIPDDLFKVQKTSYEDDVQNIKDFLKTVEKRKLTERLIFPQ